MNAKHTPLPWHFTFFPDKNGEGEYQIDAISGNEAMRNRHLWPDIASVHIHAPNETARGIAKSNAAFIVLACNSHANLLAALEAAMPYLPHTAGGTRDVIHPVLGQARAAILRAKGGQP